KFGNLYLGYLDSSLPLGTGARILLSTDGGRTLRTLDTFETFVDQPSIVVGPGPNGQLGSIWINSLDISGQIALSGAAVSGLGLVSNFITLELAPFPGTQATPITTNFGDLAVGPQGQVIMVETEDSTGAAPADLYPWLDPDGLGIAKFNAPIRVPSGKPVGP